MIVDIAPVSAQAFNFTLEIAGTAESGVDYSTVATTHTLNPNLATVAIPIRFVDDNLHEGRETAIFRITVDPVNATVHPSRDTSQMNIEDDDSPPVLSVTSQAGTEGGQNQGTQPVQGQDFTNVVFKLELVGEYQHDISMDIRAIDGTARSGRDYRLDTRLVTFTHSQNIQYVKAAVIDDLLFEGDTAETFQLRISGKTGIPPSPVVVNGLIHDDDTGTSATIEVDQSWINETQIKGNIDHRSDQDWYSTFLNQSQGGMCICQGLGKGLDVSPESFGS